jgi:hypothetical protein
MFSLGLGIVASALIRPARALPNRRFAEHALILHLFGSPCRVMMRVGPALSARVAKKCGLHGVSGLVRS